MAARLLHPGVAASTFLRELAAHAPAMIDSCKCAVATATVDADFTRNMIAHHQGAVDMAKIVIAFGKDPRIRQLAENVIKQQEGEVATMKAWLAENAPKK